MGDVILESEGVLISYHGVCFSSACGSVGEHRGVEAVEDSFDEGMGGFEIYLSEE